MEKYGKRLPVLGVVIILCIAHTYVFAQGPDSL
jgi:hypothetical protein